MKRLLGLLMMVGVLVGMSGCGKDSPTGDIPTEEETRELLVWTTTYDGGSVEEEYQYYHHPENNIRIKDGWYNSYYKNGEYREIGIYKEDVRNGEWSYFTEDGKETKGI